MERRQHTRVPIDGVAGRLGNGTPVHVTELSLEGISLEAQMALRPGQHYSLSLLEGDSVEVRAQVIWCRLDRSERIAEGRAIPIYKAGLARLGEDS